MNNFSSSSLNQYDLFLISLKFKIQELSKTPLLGQTNYAKAQLVVHSLVHRNYPVDSLPTVTGK